jgi:hypothetical protein
MNKSLLIESHFLPSLEYFCALLPFDEIILEKWEFFPKQTYRNRCYINTAHGVKILTVPLTERHGKILIQHIRVEEGKQWRNAHWKTIESAYRKAPYFDFYAHGLKEILFAGHEYLYDLNYDLLSFCLRNLGLKKNIAASVSYERPASENVKDLRSVIIDKKPFGLRSFYHPSPYYQVFGNEFAPGLSSIDLLLGEGPGSLAVLRASAGLANK